MDENVTNIAYKPQILVISDRKELYKCYMPFIKGGGLFLPFNEDITPDKIAPNQKILVIFSILDHKEKIPISGKVVWISRGGPNKGFGIALGEGASMKSLKDQIENLIIDFTSKKESTYTF